MHELLKQIILNPQKIHKKLSKNKSQLSKQIVQLVKLNPYQLFLTIINSWFHYKTQETIADTIIIDPNLIKNFKDIDDLYYQIAESYKEATDKISPIKTEYIISESPLKIKCTTKPLIIIKPKYENNTLTIDPKELNITIYYIDQTTNPAEVQI